MCPYDSCLCVFRQLLAFNPAVHRTTSASAILPTDSDIFLLLMRISQGSRTRDRQIASRDTCQGDIRLQVTRLFSPNMQRISENRGQNIPLLCLHVRRSGLRCQPEPPMLPTRSVIRISTMLPWGSSISAAPVTPGKGRVIAVGTA